MIVDARESVKIPDGVDFETAAPMACAGYTVYRAILQAGIKSGGTETLAIVGAGGGLGHLGCQFARVLGIRVVGIDAKDEGLKLAKESGANIVLDARKPQEQVAKEVHDATDGKGVDATVNLSDHEHAAALSCAITKLHGTMVQIAQVSCPQFYQWEL